jgi:hypothetical protein
MDYASNVWSHACGVRQLSWLNRAQRIGAQAITGAFQTVSTTVAEAEASIQTVCKRHAQAGTRLYISVRTTQGASACDTQSVSEPKAYLADKETGTWA